MDNVFMKKNWTARELEDWYKECYRLTEAVYYNTPSIKYDLQRRRNAMLWEIWRTIANCIGRDKYDRA